MWLSALKTAFTYATVMTGGMTSGLGTVVWPAALVEGAGEVVEGEAWWLPLEHAATNSAAVKPRARCLRLIASRELSHMRGRLRNGWLSQVGGCVRQVHRET